MEAILISTSSVLCVAVAAYGFLVSLVWYIVLFLSLFMIINTWHKEIRQIINQTRLKLFDLKVILNPNIATPQRRKFSFYDNEYPTQRNYLEIKLQVEMIWPENPTPLKGKFKRVHIIPPNQISEPTTLPQNISDSPSPSPLRKKNSRVECLSVMRIQARFLVRSEWDQHSWKAWYGALDLVSKRYLLNS